MIGVEVRDFMLKIELPRSLFTNSMRRRILARKSWRYHYIHIFDSVFIEIPLKRYIARGEPFENVISKIFKYLGLKVDKRDTIWGNSREQYNFYLYCAALQRRKRKRLLYL